MSTKYILRFFLLIIIFSTQDPVFAKRKKESGLAFRVKEKYYQDKINEHKLPLFDRLIAYDSLIDMFSRADSVQKKKKLLIDKARVCMQEGEYLFAYENYLSALSLIKESKDFDNEKAEILFQLGKSARNLGLYEESIHYLFQLLQEAKERDKDYVVKAYSFIGGIYMETKNIVMANRYLSKAISLLESETNYKTETFVDVYNNYAGICFKRGQADSALWYIFKSSDHLEKLDDNHRKITYLNNLSIIYEQLNDPITSLNCLEKALNLAEKNTLNYSKAITLFGIASHFERRGNKLKAEAYYKECILLAEQKKMLRILTETQKKYSDFLYKQGKVNEAYILFKKAQTINDSVFNERNAEKIILISESFEKYKMEAENARLQQSLIIGNKTVILVFVVILLIILSYFVFSTRKRLREQTAAAEALNISLEEVKEQTDITLKENTQELNEIIEQKNRELTSKALFLSRNKEYVSMAIACLEKHKQTEVQEEKELYMQECIQWLSRLDFEKTWEEFRLYFEQLNGNFYKQLEVLAPGLTKSELRLCALLALNLTAKEIASITNRSSRTVETFNYRIRKKLSIPSEEKTSSFLRKLLT